MHGRRASEVVGFSSLLLTLPLRPAALLYFGEGIGQGGGILFITDFHSDK
jgi:hypothetical protein